MHYTLGSGWLLVGHDFLNREGVELGRATTLMITTLFLDELFFVISCPLVILFTPVNEIFNSGSGAFSSGIKLTFWLVYSGICLWTLLLFLGIIVKPAAIRNVIIKLFSIRFLRRWQPAVIALGDNMVATSVELRKSVSASGWKCLEAPLSHGRRAIWLLTPFSWPFSPPR